MSPAQHIPPEHDHPPDDRAARLQQLIRERDTLRDALPAHSTPPTLLMRLEDLDDAIAALRAEIAAQNDRSAGIS